MANSVQRIADTLPVLTPGMDVIPVRWSSTFYDDLDRRFGGFAGHVLVSCHEFTEPWTTWEMHPRGDEVVMLMTGEATLVLRREGKNSELPLRSPGEYAVVPRGTWHTARITARARMLFITPGEGTQNCAAPP